MTWNAVVTDGVLDNYVQTVFDAKQEEFYVLRRGRLSHQPPSRRLHTEAWGFLLSGDQGKDQARLAPETERT